MGRDRTVRIAIVEDKEVDAQQLKGYIMQFQNESCIPMYVTHFSNGMNFLDEYTNDFDVVFMDIEMPHLNGMETAKKLRKVDASVALVFITNMAQYAIAGYEVSAVDFMVKPVGYYGATDLIAGFQEKAQHILLLLPCKIYIQN